MAAAKQQELEDRQAAAAKIEASRELMASVVAGAAVIAAVTDSVAMPSMAQLSGLSVG